MRYVVMVLFCLTISGVKGQGNQAKQDSIPYELTKQAYIYTVAKQYNDPAIARMALYNLLAINPGSAPILDSLAKIYYEYQQYASAALAAQDAMKINPDDMFAVELAASAFDNLGVKNRAITNYEKLYLNNNDLTTLYKIAFLQFEIRNYGESLNNVEIVINSPKSDDLSLVFPTQNGRGQEVSLKAATIRLKGMIEQEKGNVDTAKELYNQALEMEPEFELIKNQLAELD